MLSILLPCRTFTVVFRYLILFLRKVSYSVQTHSLHCYLHGGYTLTLSYLHCRISMLNFFFQKVSYSECTHSLHCYVHAVYSLTLSYFHCRILMLDFIYSVGKFLTLCIVNYMLSILLPCCTFIVVFRCLILFFQEVSYSECTHSLHYYLHAVYSLTLSFLHCHILMLNFIPSVGKLF